MGSIDYTNVYDGALIQHARKRIMAASPHLETASDSLINFSTDIAAPLKECKVYFEPVQEGEGEPSPENVRPIRGWNEVEAYKSGKNIAKVAGYSAMNSGSADIHTSTENQYGTHIDTTEYNMPDTSLTITQSITISDVAPVSYRNGYFCVMVKNLIYGQNYDVSFKVTNIKANPLNATLQDLRLCVPSGMGYHPAKIQNNVLIYKNVSWLRYSGDPTAPHYNRSNFEIRNCGMSFTLSEFMVTPVGMNDGVFEPYCGEVMPVTFPAEVGTIYGGYVDLIKGKLIQEWIQVKINSLSWTYMSSGECFRSSVPMERRGHREISPVRSSIYKTLEVDRIISSWKGREDYSISEHIGNSGDKLIQSIHIKDSRYTTVSDFLNGVGNENIVYKLLTPIEYSITHETLKTLRGTNNIWSTSNGPISIKYWKH